MANEDFLAAAKDAFCETIALKLQQLRRIVPKATNSEITGDFVESVVRGFVGDWISPCQLLSGTLYPHDSMPLESFHEEFRVNAHSPKQIDGIVFDPRLGPPVIKEDGFVVTHPAFCRGIIEIKTSEKSLMSLEKRLQSLYYQYMCKFDAVTPQVMGIVIQDPEPETHSHPEWMTRSLPEGEKKGWPIFSYNLVPHCPIFVLFNNDYEPFMPAVDAMIRAVFRVFHFSRPIM